MTNMLQYTSRGNRMLWFLKIFQWNFFFSLNITFSTAVDFFSRHIHYLGCLRMSLSPFRMTVENFVRPKKNYGQNTSCTKYGICFPHEQHDLWSSEISTSFASQNLAVLCVKRSYNVFNNLFIYYQSCMWSLPCFETFNILKIDFN